MVDRRGKRPRSTSPTPLGTIFTPVARQPEPGGKTQRIQDNEGLGRVRRPDPLQEGLSRASHGYDPLLQRHIFRVDVRDNLPKTTIIERINRELGYRALTELILKIGTVKAPFKVKSAPIARAMKDLTTEDKTFIETVTNGIKDDKLKSLIKRSANPEVKSEQPLQVQPHPHSQARQEKQKPSFLALTEVSEAALH